MNEYQKELIVSPPKGVATFTTNAQKKPQDYQMDSKPKNSQDFYLEQKAKNCENISKVTPETQLADLCPVWKTSLSPVSSNF